LEAPKEIDSLKDINEKGKLIRQFNIKIRMTDCGVDSFPTED